MIFVKIIIIIKKYIIYFFKKKRRHVLLFQIKDVARRQKRLTSTAQKDDTIPGPIRDLIEGPDVLGI